MAISYLPFEPAFWVWSAGLTLASIGLLRRAGFSGVVVEVSMLRPAALWNAELGQFGTMTGVGVVASLALSARRPAGGGVVLGLLVVKPQAGLLVPVALLARGQWRRLAVAAGTGLAACLAVTLAAGWTVWPAYFTRGAAASKAVLEALFPAADYEKFGISVFWMLRLAGAGLGAAYLAQAVCAMGAVFLAWRVWRDERGPALDRIGLTVSLSLLATPYGYTDDMVGWSVMLAALAERRGWRIDLLDALFWVWPALAPVVFLRTGFLATPVVVGLAAWRIWRRREVQMMP